MPTQFFKSQTVMGDNKYTYDALYRLLTATGRENNAAVNFTSADNTDDSPFILKHGANDAMNMQSYTQNYNYDAVGNILQLQHSAAQGSYTRNYTYNSGNNRLLTTQIGSNTPYTYNHHAQHGYITGLPHLTVLNWNFKEEVVATSKQVFSSGTPETTYYQYDSKGKRLRKVTENASTSSTFTKKDSRIYIEGYEFYENFSGTAYVTHCLSLIDSGQRFVMIESTTNPALAGYLVRYQHPNHQSSSTLETDDVGAVISYEEYHPFGTTSYQAMEKPVRAAAKRYRYTGMERDEETGLSYHNARYYISWLGRWLNPDPIGIGDGVNVYAYCHNNPVVLKDESGNGPGDNPYLVNKSDYTRQDNTKLPKNLSLKGFIKATEDASKANEKKVVLNNPTSNKLYVAPGHEPPAFLKPKKNDRPTEHASPTSTRIEGTFQIIGGLIEAIVGGVGGVLSAETGIGAMVGWGVLVHGSDNMASGLNKLISGQQNQTFTEQVISESAQNIGLDRTTSNKIGAFGNTIIGIAGSGNLVNQFDALVVNSRKVNFASITDEVAVANGGGRSLNPLVGDMNCAGCALAGDATLKGRPSSALVHDVTSTDEILKHFGLTSWSTGNTKTSLIAKMESFGNGTTGIVFGFRGVDEVGHFFNVINKGNKINFLDFQKAGSAVMKDTEFETFKSYWLINTTGL